MQNKIALALLFLSSMASANEHCKEGSLFQKLSLHNGTREIGDCVIETHVCEKSNSSLNLPFYLTHALGENSAFWMGDVLVKHKNGQSLYIPLYATEGKFPNTWITVSETKNAVSYNYKDKNFDPVSGRKENYQITMAKRRTRIEFIMNSSLESRKRPLRSLFLPDIKIICDQKI